MPQIFCSTPNKRKGKFLGRNLGDTDVLVSYVLALSILVAYIA